MGNLKESKNNLFEQGKDPDPLKKDADPLKRDADPLKKDADPLKKDADPLKKDSDPLKKDSDPLKKDTDTGVGHTDTTLTGDDLKAGKFVKIGMRGKIVGDIQRLLIKLGYTDISKSGNPDDIFGRRTKASVEEFQRNNNAKDDGAVGSETWPKLNDPAAIKKGASSSSSAVGGAQAEVPKDGETTAGSDAIIIKESLRKSLRKNLLKFN
jgi:peptidoglycan hydrolase-like protein with peptidoglycan-binding domain